VGMKDDTHIGLWGNTGAGWGLYMDTTGGTVTIPGLVCAANVFCISDERLKQNIQGLNAGLSQLMRLRPVRWEWKDRTTTQLPIGLIAQEVDRVLPELVLRDSDPTKPLGVNYMGLLPVVVKAIQEQQAAFDLNTAAVASLQAENAALKTLNNELEARLAAVERALQQLVDQRKQ